MNSEPAVIFDAVDKSFGASQVFRHLSLRLPKDQVTAIVGSSGSGKTTLLQMINGLEAADAGLIEVLGQAVPTQRLESFRRGIGYAVQGAGLFPHLTARQNVTLVAKLEGWSEARMEDRFASLLNTVGLPADVAERLPRQLSGGQQQRLGICRALMLQPPILLLDEPFSAVDPITRLGLYESFEQTASNASFHHSVGDPRPSRSSPASGFFCDFRSRQGSAKRPSSRRSRASGNALRRAID